MTQKPNGGRAFPAGTHKVYDEDGFMLGSGMSLRDYFAGQALAAMGNIMCSDGGPDSLMERPKNLSSWAYAYADAMIAARGAG